MKDFIPYDQALSLKELGFDEECLTSYNTNKELMDIWSAPGLLSNSSLKDIKNFNAISNSMLLKDYLNNNFIAVPTYAQAFRWFREKHNTFASVNVNYVYNIYIDDEFDQISNNHHSYEEAENACLYQLIEIVKDKQNG